MAATFVDILTRIPNNAPLTYGQMDTNLTTLQQNMPIGAYIDYPVADAIPPTWLECDGAVLDQTAYAALFGVLGTTFNTGGESGSEFRLPDTRGYFPRHLDSTGTVDPDGAGRTIGDTQADGFKSHSHNSSTKFGRIGDTGSAIDVAADRDRGGAGAFNTSLNGGAETRPKNMSVIRLIKALSVVAV